MLGGPISDDHMHKHICTHVLTHMFLHTCKNSHKHIYTDAYYHTHKKMEKENVETIERHIVEFHTSFTYFSFSMITFAC